MEKSTDLQNGALNKKTLNSSFFRSWSHLVELHGIPHHFACVAKATGYCRNAILYSNESSFHFIALNTYLGLCELNPPGTKILPRPKQPKHSFIL